MSHPAYDRLLTGSPLRRSGVSKAITIALLVILAFATLIQLVIFTSMPPGLFSVFLRALALSSLLALVPLSILWFLDRHERESPWLFAAAFLWGGLIATALSLPFNTAFLSLVDRWLAHHPLLEVILGPNASLMIVAPISAPIVEEIAKALGVVLLFWLLRPEFDNMRDGLIYGALVGLGFTWFEAALYVAKMYAKFGVPAFGLQLGVRYALFGLGGHAMFTAIFGAFLGLALQTRRKWLRILAPIVGLLLAMAAHMLNNALPLFATLAKINAGQLPSAKRTDPRRRVSPGFRNGQFDATNHIRSVLAHICICHMAQRRVGTTRDPRGARRRNWGSGDPRGVPCHFQRSCVAYASDRPGGSTNFRRTRERSE